MKFYTISKLAGEFGLSRSTLLYYDSIGLLRPHSRNDAGYRKYSERERDRLKEICLYRNTGMSLDAIRQIIAGKKNGSLEETLRKRLKTINAEVIKLRVQQRVIASMLSDASKQEKTVIDREFWTRIFRNTGMSSEDMKNWHRELEQNSPAAHREILTFIGFSPEEIEEICKWSIS
jgi:DNA-binding transcriptional MerR regulator